MNKFEKDFPDIKNKIDMDIKIQEELKRAEDLLNRINFTKDDLDIVCELLLDLKSLVGEDHSAQSKKLDYLYHKFSKKNEKIFNNINSNEEQN